MNQILMTKVVKGKRARVVIVGGIGLVALVSLGVLRGQGREKKDTFGLHRAERAELVVSVKEGGTLEPVNQTTIRNEMSGTNRIVYLVAEGTFVEKDQLLVELDASESESRLERRQLSYQSRQAARASAESRLLIVKSDADSDIRKAQLKVDFARMDLEKFEKLEKTHLLRDAELSVLLAEETLRMSEERYRNSKMLADAGFETDSTVSRDRLTVTSDGARLEKARTSEEAKTRFDTVRLYHKLAAGLVESQKDLVRTKKETERRIAQAEAKLTSAELALDLAKSAVEESEAQVAAAKIYAPHAGMVVYGGSSSSTSRDAMIEEGAMVRNLQELITIPDTSAMKIAVKIHETMASDIQEGQEAVVTLDTAPDKILRGRVSHVALFPDKQSFWSQSNSLVYSAEITLAETVEEVPPGASGTAQIIVHYLEDALTVPIDAVTTIEGQQIVELMLPNDETETRPIEVGVVNEKRVQVLSGINEGDMVIMREAS